MMGYDDQAPGPGSYNIHHQKQLKKKPIKHQFFGSTVQRFQTDFSETNDVGPGEYYSSQKLKKNNSRNKLRKPSQYRKKASQQQDESFEASNVGPGSYNHHNFKVNTYNTKLLNGNGAFGSHNPRFQTQKRQQQVMTKSKIDFMASQDKQRKQRIEQALNMRKKVLQNKPHSIFNSETKRNCFQDCAYRQNVPFGAYEVNNEDISTKLQKKKQYEKQIAECNLKRPGFMSTVQRFQGHKQQKSQHKDCWCLIRQVEKRSIQHQSAVFESKSKRTQIFEQKNTGPAVGEYSKNSDFVKQSFNSRFIKQNQNKSKKMKMWKKTKQ